MSGTAVRGEALPPLEESQLDDVMVPIADLNRIVDSTEMEVTSEIDTMSDHSGDVSDPECLGAVYGAEETVYQHSRWTSMLDQIAREPTDDNDHWVEQTAVIYPSDADARRFFEASKEAWGKCANYTVTVRGDDTDSLWDIDEVTTAGDMIIQTSIQQHVNGWGCQHALAVSGNLTTETWACSYSPGDEAAQIAEEMIARATER